MDTIVLIEPAPASAIVQLEKVFMVKKLASIIDLAPLLQKQKVKAVFCPVRLYHPNFQQQWCLASNKPKLVLIRCRLDKMDCEMNDPVFYWKDPYTLKSLIDFIQENRSVLRTDLQRIHVMENRKLKVIREGDILLIKKIPPGQVLIHTREGDHLINANLSTVEALLSTGNMERISDQLLIPAGARQQITRNGYAFRGGFIPIQDRYIRTRKKIGTGKIADQIFSEQEL